MNALLSYVKGRSLSTKRHTLSHMLQFIHHSDYRLFGR